MRTLRSVDELRAALAGVRRSERTIGLVPTMGAFHEGHLSLFRRARAECDQVVASLFVNPAQFRPGEDLDAYPRDEAGDALLAAEEGVDLLFAPPLEEVYPAGFATTVSVAGVTEPLEGEVRGREHFDGVTTVVAKLFNMVGPDVAYFGQKDAQQAAAIRRHGLRPQLPRPHRGLPDRTRGRRPRPLQPQRVPRRGRPRPCRGAAPRAEAAAEAAVADGERDPARVVAAARGALAELEVDPDYVEVVGPGHLLTRRADRRRSTDRRCGPCRADTPDRQHPPHHQPNKDPR